MGCYVSKPPPTLFDDRLWLRRVAMTKDCVFTAHEEGVIKAWRRSDGVLMRTFEGNTYSIQSLAVSPDHRFLVGLEDHGVLTVWHTSDGAFRHRIGSNLDRISCMALNSDFVVFTVESSDCVRFWRLSDNTFRSGLFRFHYPRIRCLALNSEVAVSGHSSRGICVWRLADGAYLRGMDVGPHSITCIAVDSNVVVFGVFSFHDGNLKIRRLSDGAHLRTLSGHRSVVTRILITRRYIVSTGDDDRIKVWRRSDGKLVHTFECDKHWDVHIAHNSRTLSICWNPLRIATVKLPLDRLDVLLWAVARGRIRRPRRYH